MDGKTRLSLLSIPSLTADYGTDRVIKKTELLHGQLCLYCKRSVVLGLLQSFQSSFDQGFCVGWVVDT